MDTNWVGGLAAVNPRSMVWIAVVSAVLLGVALAAFLILWRWLKPSKDSGHIPGNAFDLNEIRRLHKQGQISEQEYEVLKNQVVHQMK